MMRSMYTAVSGLRTHQGKMDTIGHNIANVNTVGFKRGQVTFKEAFSQVLNGASAPQGGRGGTNPQQVGMGVNMGSIATIHTIGNSQRTDNATDLMINGEGFFTVSDDVSFNNRYYTRAGNFTTDRDGNLVTVEGFKVLGYKFNEDGTVNNTVSGIQINKSDTSAPKATQDIVFKGNLDSNTPVGEKKKIDTTIQDTLGNSYSVTYEVEREADGWKMSLSRITDLASGYYNTTDVGGMLEPNDIKIEFDANGKLINKDALIANLNITEGITFHEDGDTNKESVVAGGKFGDKDGKISIFDPTKPETTANLTQYANEFDLKPYKMNGNTSGTLESFSIDGTGTVVGVYTNGDRKAIAQLMLAKFDNPAGLQKQGNNFFVDTRNSGEPQLGSAGGRGYGDILGGTLEMSNVDISLEFTEMITTQRGFQANSRVITTSDEMLQELVNIKR